MKCACKNCRMEADTETAHKNWIRIGNRYLCCKDHAVAYRITKEQLLDDYLLPYYRRAGEDEYYWTARLTQQINKLHKDGWSFGEIYLALKYYTTSLGATYDTRYGIHQFSQYLSVAVKRTAVGVKLRDSKNVIHYTYETVYVVPREQEEEEYIIEPPEGM